MDTIELSNLNRQFLFKESDVKKSKSLVKQNFLQKNKFNFCLKKTKIAKENLKDFFPNQNLEIEAYVNDINEWKIERFKEFDLIISALDNKGARYSLGYISLLTGVPLIDCGSTGQIKI
jgi:ubiquitin-like 1-activating enzyme E1 B